MYENLIWFLNVLAWNVNKIHNHGNLYLNIRRKSCKTILNYNNYYKQYIYICIELLLVHSVDFSSHLYCVRELDMFYLHFYIWKLFLLLIPKFIVYCIRKKVLQPMNNECSPGRERHIKNPATNNKTNYRLLFE